MKVFITRIIPEAGLRLFREAGIEITQWEEKRELTQQELIDHCKQADALLTAGRSTINAAFLKECSHLKAVSLFAVGYDNVDVPEATRLGIPIGHTPDVLSKATADIAFLLMQNTARKAFFHHKRILNGDWNFFEPMANIGLDLQGKTLGVFGLGKIGFEMAKSCKGAFEMDILYHNRSQNAEAEEKLQAKKVSFEELLAQSDVISVHANLTEETKGLFNKETFGKMKPNAIFVNTARGAIHNEEDLLEALQQKTIWGAGLDVTNPEPMDKDNVLLSLPNVAVLPHIGSSTEETRNNMAILAAKNAIAGIRNERLPKVVNPEVYESKKS
ncbi:lactate dehydrogenase-like 2-hydroxyacid dehydrogenase [Flavobacterium endophyticum]|uniref:Glyoxylate/hydroxypyruvate reductase B n=1 Tax=Flavobacterium endophyticum TaxID=1540163 RepID=A0A495MQD9_9FLAO|nr:D-glycerate dehydrogenase [Flavobacterium endophyticum]RKS26539.1 lactate dehydrogenase-like 2-hydroxyacid dehydrogenase [Flavobacterium endophyticum]